MNMTEKNIVSTSKEEKNKDVILSIKDLSIYYLTRQKGTCKAVNDLSFEIERGETVGLVGETGAGKTTVALGVLQLLQSPPGKIMSGSIVFNGKNLIDVDEKEMMSIRGREISMIFQDPMTALNPVLKVGDQVAEVIKLHEDISDHEAKEKAIKMLETVGISPDRYEEYAHQFSGGMKQRIVIAMALACSPELLLADEPTTALDVTIRHKYLI
jgi:peptide/nickel transport system ATP-binding protein